MKCQRMLSQAAFSLPTSLPVKSWIFICFCVRSKLFSRISEVRSSPSSFTPILWPPRQDCRFESFGFIPPPPTPPRPTSSSPVSPEVLQTKLCGQKSWKNYPRFVFLLLLFYCCMWKKICRKTIELFQTFRSFCSLPEWTREFPNGNFKGFSERLYIIAPIADVIIAPFWRFFQ
jgi:hypothetical protein